MDDVAPVHGLLIPNVFLEGLGDRRDCCGDLDINVLVDAVAVVADDE